MMYSETFDYTSPLSAFVYKWLDTIFGASKWSHYILSTFLIIVQASILNFTLLKNKAYDENNYLPAFLYVVLMSGVIDFFTLSPQLMSLTFILLALNQIFRRIDNIVTDELFLSSGLYIGIATFFYFPSAVFFLILLLSFILFSSAILRRILLYVYGSLLVFLVILGYFFWFDSAGSFLQTVFDFKRPRTYMLTTVQFIQSGAVIGISLLLGLFTLFSTRFTNFQQKMIQVMVLLMVGAILSMFLINELSGIELILFVPTTAFLLTHYFLNLRRRIWRFLMPYLIVGMLTVYPWIFLQNWAPSTLFIEPTDFPIEGKHIMTIGGNWEVFIDNTVATPFIDDFFSEKKLEGLDYYDQASDLFQIMIKSDPEIILDDLGYMPKMMRRFPEIERRYRLTKNGYYTRVNN